MTSNALGAKTIDNQSLLVNQRHESIVSSAGEENRIQRQKIKSSNEAPVPKRNKTNDNIDLDLEAKDYRRSLDDLKQLHHHVSQAITYSAKRS